MGVDFRCGKWFVFVCVESGVYGARPGMQNRAAGEEGLYSTLIFSTLNNIVAA